MCFALNSNCAQQPAQKNANFSLFCLDVNLYLDIIDTNPKPIRCHSSLISVMLLNFSVIWIYSPNLLKYLFKCFWLVILLHHKIFFLLIPENSFSSLRNNGTFIKFVLLNKTLKAAILIIHLTSVMLIANVIHAHEFHKEYTSEFHCPHAQWIYFCYGLSDLLIHRNADTNCVKYVR